MFPLAYLSNIKRQNLNQIYTKSFKFTNCQRPTPSSHSNYLAHRFTANSPKDMFSIYSTVSIIFCLTLCMYDSKQTKIKEDSEEFRNIQTIYICVLVFPIGARIIMKLFYSLYYTILLINILLFQNRQWAESLLGLIDY